MSELYEQETLRLLDNDSTTVTTQSTGPMYSDMDSGLSYAKVNALAEFGGQAMHVGLALSKGHHDVQQLSESQKSL